MHERSIAEDLVRAAGVAAVDEGGSVAALHITVGSLSCIDPNALHDQIVWYSQGTIAEGAIVNVEVLPADPTDSHGADIRLAAVDVGS